ncbi:DNA polymerase iota isoform X2 [Elgaria multicarinata webbii]
MICNPSLRGKPLGVQQKSTVITCNYEARNVGLKKCMSVREAKEKCPDLVLVNGEDLTKYREISYKVTALLEEFTPLVERLGFDENFVDITDIVEIRLEQWKKEFSTISWSGHIYKNQTVDLRNPTHRRLAVGSQIAAEMREAMHSRLGLTGCAGVASNKLLSKLVSGIFKPNQQTVLLPEGRQDLLANLDHIRKVPGIGFKTAKRLVALGLGTVCDLQMCSAGILERELGVLAAQHIQKLSWGEDDSPVTPSGAPQSLSDEDSFKKCSSEAEVRKKVEELLANLLDRLRKDGRKPHTIRLTIRQFSSVNKWPNRESRQCPIPSHVVQRIRTDDSNVKTYLVAILMKLFRKMVSVEVPFHLTLLNVCFSNLKDPPASAKQSIGFYLTRPSTSSNSEKRVHKMANMNAQYATPEGQMDTCEVSPGARNAQGVKASPETPGLPKATGVLEFPIHLLPAGVDHNVFNQLPKDIKEEIISSHKGERDNAATLLSQTLAALSEESLDGAQDKTSHASLHSRSTHQNHCSSPLCNITSTSEEPPLAVYACTSKHLVPQHHSLEAAETASVTGCTESVDVKNSSPTLSQPSLLWACIPEGQKYPDGPGLDGEASHDESWKEGPKLVLPPTVDPKTFSELPTEIQKELLVEWKGRDPVSKTQASKSHDRLKRQKKGLPSPSQSNILLRYFKPQ